MRLRLFSSFLLVAATPFALNATTTESRAASPRSQESAAQDEETDLEKFLRLAQTGRAVVRPQAAEKLVEIGAEAARALRELCGDDGGGTAALGKDIVSVLGDFGDPELRAHLWRALGDPDFPWRPSAARSLSKTADARELARIDELFVDPLAAVRIAAIESWNKLAQKDRIERVRDAPDDSNDLVRRTAARVLHGWGDDCALFWLIEDLRRDDRYFNLPNGRTARYESLRILKEVFGGDQGYNARNAPNEPSNVEAIERFNDLALQKCGKRPELPIVARASAPTEGDVLGLELRSCRRGEFFLRWNAEDVLYVGTGNPARVELPKGSVARLMQKAQALFESLDGRFWGEPGCDLEQFHFRPLGEKRTRSYRVNKGPDAVDGLRPAALSELATLFCETLPADGDDPRLASLAERVREALSVLGGPIAPPEDARR